VATISQDEAIKRILAAGWLPSYPIKNVPLTQNYFYDPKVGKGIAYAWLAAYEKMIERQQPEFEFER